MPEKIFEKLMRKLASMQYENRLDRQMGDQPRWSDGELEAISDEIETLRLRNVVTNF